MNLGRNSGNSGHLLTFLSQNFDVLGTFCGRKYVHLDVIQNTACWYPCESLVAVGRASGQNCCHVPVKGAWEQWEQSSVGTSEPISRESTMLNADVNVNSDTVRHHSRPDVFLLLLYRHTNAPGDRSVPGYVKFDFP